MNSVCMASYNGSLYIKKQLLSIIEELDSNDEIIIVDDKSTDNTVEVIENINDPRIKLYHNSENKGPTYSFGKAISLARGDIIFLADQDDIWVKGRTKLMSGKLFNDSTKLVSSNFDCFDDSGNSYPQLDNKVDENYSNACFKNILDIFKGKLNYFGCAMAFKNELKNIITPIPSFVESHDLWIAMAANLLKSNSHLESITLHRRIHGNNASVVKRKLYKKIISRFIFCISIIVLWKRIAFKRNG